MMFDTINYLLFENRNPELDNEILEAFSPYMVTRFLSFYDKGVLADYANTTLNMYSGIFKNEEDKFLFFENVIPKLPKKKITYIKKNTEKEKTEEELPVPEFYSKRELKMLKL